MSEYSQQIKRDIDNFQMAVQKLGTGIKAVIPQFSYGGRQCRFLHGQTVGKYCPVQFCDALRHSDAFL